MNGISALKQKRSQRAPQPIPLCADTVIRQLSVNQKKGSHQTWNLPEPWPSTSQSPELWDINVCCLATQFLLPCFKNPNRLRQKHIRYTWYGQNSRQLWKLSSLYVQFEKNAIQGWFGTFAPWIMQGARILNFLPVFFFFSTLLWIWARFYQFPVEVHLHPRSPSSPENTFWKLHRKCIPLLAKARHMED